MTRNQTRRSITVSPSSYARIAAYCQAHGLPLSRFIESLLSGDLADGVTPPPRQSVQEWADVVPMDIDPALMSLLDDQVIRQREMHGRETTAGDLLDQAITRMLNAAGAP